MSAEFTWPVRVYHEDVDTTGVVYYAAYLRFMERARTEWLRALGIEQRRLAAEHRLVFTVSRLSIEYLGPARHDDALSVSVRIVRRGRAGMVLAQRVCLVPHGREEEELLCRAEVRIACVDAETFKPRALPPRLA